MTEHDETTSPFFRSAEEAMQSDVLDRMHAYPAPPPEMDLLAATEMELARHGLPRRPDPEREPRLFELWSRHLERPFEYVPAKFSIDPILGRRDPLWRRPGHPRGLEDEGSFGPSGWGGVVARPPSYGIPPYRRTSDPARTVFARWTVPGIFPASNLGGDITAGFWVGLDGWTNQQVLQAGVAVTVHPTATVEWWAWKEWWTKEYKSPPVRIDNFPVSSGDDVSVLVCAPEPDYGFAAFQNHTTQQATSARIDRPGTDITSVGATAEWIVEGISADLPVFLPSITFTGCTAGPNRADLPGFDLIPWGFTTEIAGSAPGSKLTATTIASDTVAVVQWTGWT